MRKDKEYIFKLRQEGKSFRDIQKETGVSRATLSTWFKEISWSKHLSDEHRKRNQGASKERMERMNMVRKLKLQYQYALVESEAVRQYEVFRKEPLFWAGLMVYAGEGDKRSKHHIRITNTEFYMHRIFISFLERYLGRSRGEIRASLVLYPDHDEVYCRTVWSNELGIARENFHKTQVIQGKEQVRRLQYGVGMSIITNTALKKKILKWIDLARTEQFGIDAVIV